MILAPLSRRAHTSARLHIPRIMPARHYNNNASNSRANLFPSVDKTTGQRLDSFCKTRGITWHTEILRSSGSFDTAQLHTLEIQQRVEAQGSLLYFHGGGYTYPAGPGHFKLSIQLAHLMKCRKLHILQYSLLPQAKYPTQLAQAVEALQFLLKGQTPPDQIAIAGDSAGGNLVLGLLAHLNTPHPDITPVSMSSPLASAIAISPRCSNSTAAESFIYNADKDIIDAAGLNEFVQKWQPVSDHVWAAADRGPEGFWTAEDAINADKMLLVAGEDECYLDDIRDFAKLISAGDPKEVGDTAARQLIIARRSVHVQAVVDLAMGIDNGFMTKALLDWANKNPIGPTVRV